MSRRVSNKLVVKQIRDLLGIAAAASWGTTTLTIRLSRLAEAPATATLLYQLVGAFVLSLGVAALTAQTGVVPSGLLAVMAGGTSS